MRLSLSSSLVIFAGLSFAAKYKWNESFESRRLEFYKNERRIADHENSKVRFHLGDSLRVAHFDAHWHGLTVEEYIKLQRATQSHILVARGVPEREGVSETIRKKLVQAGFDSSSIIESPCAALTSGMVVGVKDGIIVENSAFITLNDTNIALKVTISSDDKRDNPITLIILSLDVFDNGLRLRQLKVVHDHIMRLQDQNAHFMVMGGFHGNVRASPENRALVSSKVGIQEAFLTIYAPAPEYTSWWGDFTDTTFISKSLRHNLIDAQVWHTEVDCLPILVDFNIRVANSRPCIAKGSQFIRKHWKVAGMGVVALLCSFLITIWAIKVWRHGRDAGRRIQATGHYSDQDLKIKSRGYAMDIEHSNEKN